MTYDEFRRTARPAGELIGRNTRRHPGFGRRRPYVSPRVRRAKRQARIAALAFLLAALVLFGAAWGVMGAANSIDRYGDPRNWGDLAGIAAFLAMAGVGSIAVAILAATEA